MKEMRTVTNSELRQQQFISLYKEAFPAFARFVSRTGGNLDEAKDVFQDAVISWYEKSAAGDLKITASEKAYVLGAAKYLWIRRFKNLTHFSSLDSTAAAGYTEAEDVKPAEHKLLHYLESAGQKCMELLKAFYYDKLSVAKLAEQFGFSGERSAAAQKYKCIEKVRREVKQKSLSYADFIE